MATWNYTSTNPLEVFQGVNTLTNGLFGASMVILIWLIVFFRQSYETTRDRIVAANFMAAFSGFFLAFMGVASDYVLYTSILLFAGSVVLLVTR